MELYDNMLCAGYADLEGIISYDALQKQVQRGSVKQVQVGGNGRKALFLVDSFPSQVKNALYKTHPDLQEQAASREFLDTIEPDGLAMNFYAEYKVEGARGLSFAKQQEYSNNAAILEAFRKRIEKADSQRLRQSYPRIKKTEFWARAARALRRIGDKYPHSLPENPRRLQEKFNQFFQGGKPNYEMLVTGKFGTRNAAKVATNEQQSVIIKLLSDHRNFDNEQVVMFYNIIAEQMSWTQITVETIRRYRRKYALLTSAGRLGDTEFRNRLAMQVKRRRPKFPLYMWSLDGWVCELLFQEYADGATTYHNRLVVEVVLDPCVNYPIGYAIGRQEDTALIKAALKDAVNHTAELFGRRYRAHQVQSDRFAIKKMTPFYEAVGAEYTPAQVGNAKSKPVERYFLTLNKRYGQLFENWSGFGITSNKTLQPNADAIDLLKKKFPDEAGCRAQIEQIIASERAAKREEYLKLWAEVPEERRLVFPLEQYLLHFGDETGYKNALEGSGLNVKLLGARCSYDCFDPRFRQYAHVRWNVKYDPDNLDHVLAVNDDGTLQFLLESKYVQPMAKIERTEEDVRQLSRVAEFNGGLRKDLLGQIGSASETTTNLIKDNPQLQNTLARLLISDSNGQHKQRLQQERRKPRRLPPVDVKNLEVKTAEEVAPMPSAGKKESIFNLY